MRRLALALVLLAASQVLAALPSRADAQPFVPSVLSADDVTLYREIMAAEYAGKFGRAQALYDRLSDRSLKGYVTAEHLLSPHSGRTPVAELKTWLRTYGDLPIAHRIYKLAVKRASRTVRRHHHRVKVLTTSIPEPSAVRIRGGGYEDVSPPDGPLQSAVARAALDKITAAIRADAPDDANATLQSLMAANTAPLSDVARLAQRVCASYFTEGMNEMADRFCTAGAGFGRQYAPMLDWFAGLAEFRLNNFAGAAQHFETFAQAPSIPNWTHSAAEYWAARSHMRAGDPAPVVALLTSAARDEPTFYGLLAERLLGQDPRTGFADPMLLPDEFQRIVQNPSAHRAVALWQIGGKETAYVIPELSRAFADSSRLKLDVAFAALARILGHPNLELRASETSAAQGIMLTGLFPIPQYKPLGGYTIDPSLVLAFARIESRFQPNVESPVGAKGLMQLMPATANHIGGRGAADRLSDPSYNMTLGQRYIAHLLDRYNGSLIELAAAYDAGPGRVSQWKNARQGWENDPLMFIESLGVAETRAYVKRLLTYYWMYHRRNDEYARSLDEAASGGWPIYHAPRQSAPPPPPAATDEDDNDDDTVSDITPSS